jgi:hypothetical protein
MKTPALAVISLLSPIVALAQEPAPAPATAPSPAPVQRPEPARTVRPSEVPVKVVVTVSRFAGEKKMLALPHNLVVNAPERAWGARTSLRMGIEVPLRVASPGGDKVEYKNVGTRMDCRANRIDDRYLLEITVEQSSINNPNERSSAGLADLPLFRTFNSSFTAALRDGQGTTIVAATDPVSGESVRIEVLLSVVR